jgi:tetratricopeptide (TPR) repeat protein
VREHPYLALFYGELAQIYLHAGRIENAEEEIRKAFNIVRSCGILHHPLMRKGAMLYAQIMFRRGNPAEAERQFQELINAQQVRFGKQHVLVADSITTFALMCGRNHQASWKIEKLKEALTIYRAGPDAPREMLILCLRFLGENLIASEPQVAESLLRQCVKLVQQFYGEKSNQNTIAKYVLAQALLSQPKVDDDAETLLLEVRNECTPLLSQLTKGLDVGPGLTSLLGQLTAAPVEKSAVMHSLAVFYNLRKQPAKATKALRESRSATRNDPQLLVSIAREFVYCSCLAGADREDCQREAMATLRQAIKQGYKNRQALENDAAFEAIRKMPEFQELLPKEKIAPESP